jgi:hypothetical protein
MHRYSSEYPRRWSVTDADRPGTPFSGRKDRQGAGSANSIYHWVSYAKAGMAEVPEVQEHWESISAVLEDMTAERDDYGFFHRKHAV